MSKIYRIPFSRIRAAWLRRLLMILAYPLMVAVNWFFILWAAAKAILVLPLVILVKAIAAPFKLLGDDFIEAWNGRGPGAELAAQAVTDQAKDKP
jgi:hypothetical protein